MVLRGLKLVYQYNSVFTEIVSLVVQYHRTLGDTGNKILKMYHTDYSMPINNKLCGFLFKVLKLVTKWYPGCVRLQQYNTKKSSIIMVLEWDGFNIFGTWGEKITEH